MTDIVDIAILITILAFFSWLHHSHNEWMAAVDAIERRQRAIMLELDIDEDEL